MLNKIYIGNLSWSTSDDAFREAFSGYGEITNSVVMRDANTGHSRGFGFVTYATTESAQDAVSDMNEQELDGRRLKVSISN
ncbi:hypothetical protein PS15m_001060 [Mucor circinelloides]